MKITVKYHWQLPVVMARAGYRSSTDLIEPLADRGIMLSRSQVYRLTRTPERMLNRPGFSGGRVLPTSADAGG